MPPRGKKTKKEEPAVELPPVIFFLRVGKDFLVEPLRDNVPQPIGDAGMTYSDILKETEAADVRFDEKVILDLMSRIHLQQGYPAGTACFWCCHGFSWAPFLIPTHYDFYSNMYTAEGNFCSPECALSFVYKESNLTDAQKWSRHSLIRSMYHVLYANTDIQPAPDKRCLRMFGGNLDIQQYRDFVWNSTRPLNIAMPPIRLYMPSVNTQASTRDIKSYVSLSTEAVDKASHQLRLKRSKPVHDGIATLDKCMTAK
jgi:hypothetical protein